MVTHEPLSPTSTPLVGLCNVMDESHDRLFYEYLFSMSIWGMLHHDHVCSGRAACGRMSMPCQTSFILFSCSIVFLCMTFRQNRVYSRLT